MLHLQVFIVLKLKWVVFAAAKKKEQLAEQMKDISKNFDVSIVALFQKKVSISENMCLNVVYFLFLFAVFQRSVRHK